MTKPWQTLRATELSLLLAMVCYVHSVILLCHPLLSYNSTLVIAFASVPCFFFIISNCLEMEISFHNLYWNHFLYIAAHLTAACETESNTQDLTKGYVIFFLGILFLSLYAIYVSYLYAVGSKKVEDEQQRNDKSEHNGVPVLIEISVSFIGNGIALIGRWFIPRDSFLSLMSGAGIVFSIGALLFCFYLFSSGKSKRHDQLLQESDNSVN